MSNGDLEQRKWCTSFLGPQMDRDFSEMRGRDYAKRAADLEISIAIQDGADVKFPFSRNQVTTLVQGRLQCVDSVPINSCRQYLVGVIRGRDADSLGNMVYELDVRVKSGEFRGCIVHLRDGNAHFELTGPLIAVFPLPMDREFSTGPLEWEIVRVRLK